jgi:Protein of unknown function (DUF2802)
MSTPEMTSTNLWLLTLMMLLAGGAVAACAWMYLQLRELRAQHCELASMVARSLGERELLATLSTAAEARAARTERECADFAERIGVLELKSDVRSYDRAIESARQGAEPSVLSSQFGLSQTEARLLSLLHRTPLRA